MRGSLGHRGENQERETREKRRDNGAGSVYLRGRVWWIAYTGPDGARRSESTGDERKGVAVALLRRRVGAREHNLPVITYAERLTFDEAAKAVVNDYVVNGKRSGPMVERRINKHLRPFFGGKRMASITTDMVKAYVVARLKQGIRNRKGERRADVSNAEINRELALLKRMFSLAMRSGRIATRPHIGMLKESAPRSGFFERGQIANVVAHLPAALRPVVEFTYITGWRLHSEVLPLQWRNVDFTAGEVKLDAGSTKNGEGRQFPMTAALRKLLEKQHAHHVRLKRKGQITPWVFWRMVAKGRGGKESPQPIIALTKAWKNACVAAGCPGRIPHDMRRSAVRNLVRAGIPERVAMEMTGHKTRSVFERYNIVSEGDRRDAARKLDAAETMARAARK